QQVADIGRADTVDHAMVRLGRDRPSAVGEPLDERHLPQWPMAIQALREEARCPLRELLIASGGGECRAGDVPADVKCGIVLPCGPRHPARVRLRQALPVARQLPKPAHKVLAHFLARRRAAVRLRIEDHDHAGMHVCALVGLLKLEERRVQGCQVLAHGKGTTPPRRPLGALRGRRVLAAHEAPYYFPSPGPPSALPALCATLRRKSYSVWTSWSAISKAASMMSCRLDGCSSPSDGSFSSTVSTNLRTAPIAARCPDSADANTSSESSVVRSTAPPPASVLVSGIGICLPPGTCVPPPLHSRKPVDEHSGLARLLPPRTGP